MRELRSHHDIVAAVALHVTTIIVLNPPTRTSVAHIRASRGIGATLDTQEVAAFDAEHKALLKNIAEPEFTITHRIDAHILRMGPEETD